jgi:hypothetical protein
MYEGKTNDLLIVFIGYVNDLNKLQQFIDCNALFNSLGNSTCSCPEVVLAFLLYEGSTIHNARDQVVSRVYFFFVDFAFHPSPQKKSDLYAPTSNSCFSTPIENWTHVYMNLFTQNSPYYHFLKYLLFLLKHPLYIGSRNVTEINLTFAKIHSPISPLYSSHKFCIPATDCWLQQVGRY